MSFQTKFKILLVVLLIIGVSSSIFVYQHYDEQDKKIDGPDPVIKTKPDTIKITVIEPNEPVGVNNEQPI